MDEKLISEYLAQPDYKNKILAEYLKDNLRDTLCFISTCSRAELIKAYAVLENVFMYFMNNEITYILKDRINSFKAEIRDNLSKQSEILKGYCDANYLLIKSIIDEMDPLHLIENNAPYTCYNKLIDKLYSEISILKLDYIKSKVQQVFESVDESVIQKLSERLTNAFKDGSIKKFIHYKTNNITFNTFSHNKFELRELKIDLFTHECKYNIYDYENLYYDGIDYNEYTINLSSFLFKILCNELSSNSIDLNNCKLEDFTTYKHFEVFSTYKNGKEHILLIDTIKKRYIYNIEEITYFNYVNENNKFIFDAIYNGIKKYGFKKLVINKE